MYDFETSIETPATPAQVGAVYTDVPGWLRWLAHLERIEFAGPFESGAGGEAIVQVGLSTGVKFHLEHVEPMKKFEVVWTVGPLLHTRMTHTLTPLAAGTQITHAYHTGGVMAPFNFLQADAAKERVPLALERISELAQAIPAG
jgi:hypothetical protein